MRFERFSARPRSKNWALLALVVAVVLMLLVSGKAEAHARFLRSEPGQGAVVATSPQSVEIWFTQDLFRRQGENWIIVTDSAGQEVQSGEALIDDDDRRHLSVELISPLEPGEYKVEWRNLSAEDGDSDEGEFDFAFDPLALVTSTPMLAATETPFPTLSSTPVSPTPTPPESTPVPSNEAEGEACSLGLSPAFALAALGFSLKRRRK